MCHWCVLVCVCVLPKTPCYDVHVSMRKSMHRQTADTFRRRQYRPSQRPFNLDFGFDVIWLLFLCIAVVVSRVTFYPNFYSFVLAFLIALAIRSCDSHVQRKEIVPAMAYFYPRRSADRTIRYVCGSLVAQQIPLEWEAIMRPKWSCYCRTFTANAWRAHCTLVSVFWFLINAE